MKKSKTLNDEILRDLETGKYRASYLIYNRKSTDDLNNQKNSISYQQSENLKFARRESLPIAKLSIDGFCTDGMISEKHSGFKENEEMIFRENGVIQYRIDRPKFYKLVQFLNEGYFKGFIVLCWDRISRNKSDATVARRLMNKGIDVRFVHASYDKTSAGELHLDIDGMFAEHHSRVTSEKVTTMTRNLRAKGICTYKAPIGYLNTGDMLHKPLDPDRAPIIKNLFEMYATGNWGLIDLAKWANKQGLTMPPMRLRRTAKELLDDESDDHDKQEAVTRPMTRSTVHSILKSRFYIGMIVGNDGKYVPSVSHEALITEELFNTVQRGLNKRNRSFHYSDKLAYPYRGLFKCDNCGRVYTPYLKKGIMYFNCRCKEGCSNKVRNINVASVEERIARLFSNFSFTEKELIEIDSRTRTDIALFEDKRVNEIEQNDRRKRKLREDLTYLRKNKLDFLRLMVYTPEDYLGEEERLLNEITIIQDEEQASDIAMHEVMKEVVKISELLRDIKPLYENGRPSEKEAIIKTIFSELTISNNTLQYKCKNAFKAFENRLLPICAQIERISELRQYYAEMQKGIDALRELINH